MSSSFNSNKAPLPVGLYPHAKRVGGLLFLSGVGPRKRGQIKIPGVNLNKDGDFESYDIRKQCVAVFDNIKYILEESGSSWNNIVDVTVFLTNMEKDFKIFGDKNFSDLSQEIYENNKLKKTQIDLLIQEVHGYIQGIEDIAVVGPIIKELMDVGIKNDDNLVKLATLYQRLMAKTMTAESDVALLSDEEKEELMNALEDVSTDLQKKSDEIGIEELRKKYGDS